MIIRELNYLLAGCVHLLLGLLNPTVESAAAAALIYLLRNPANMIN